MAERPVESRSFGPDVYEHVHERESMREAMSVLGFALYDLASILPLCAVGVHRYCSCCSPMFCVRCGRRDPWS